MSSNNFSSSQFSAYGVSISVNYSKYFTQKDINQCIQDAVPTELKFTDSVDTKYIFEITEAKKDKFNILKNDENVVSLVDYKQTLNRLESQIRLTIAEHAKSKVFIHAGVVGINDRAIIIPARSFKGKTTLVVELVKAGAKYYSDEYAVIDENGLIYPFPKTLSVRGIIDDYTQLERPVEFYGGLAGKKPIYAGMVLITEYIKKSHWKPRTLSQGESVLELISNTIPIRSNPGFSLKVLNKVASDAKTIKTNRGEAGRFAKKLINYFKREILD